MRSRDLALVLLSVAALIGLWAQEGTLSITNNFYIRMYSVGHHRYLPKPVVSDVDGDGYNEVLAVTQPEKLGLFETHGVGAHVASTLEPAKSFTTYSNIIGVASGYLSFPGNDTAHTAATSGLWFGGNTKKRHAMQGHKQHVAVVTDDYRLTMLTSTLVEVWTATLAESNMANTVPKTAAVVVLPDRVFESDTGVVVVAIAVSGLDGTPQESIAAFDGATGALRWRHFVTTSSSLVLKEAGPNYTASGLNFKLTEMDLAEHVNSLDWTHFRESVISSMPSAYNHPWDNALHPFRFVHTKNRKKQVRNDKLKRPQSERPKENHNLKPLSQKDGGDLGERYASALTGNKHGAKGGARRQHVRPLPNTVVLRTPSGVHFVHLFTGRTITSLVPLKRDVTYDDLDDDLVLDSVETNIGVQQEQFKRHGFSEQFVCEGVIKTNAAASESIIARGGICDSEGYINSLGLLRHLIRGDTAEQAAPHLDPLNRIGSHNVGGSSTLTVPPVVAHLRRPLGRHIFKTQRFAIFMISHGIVTALEPKHGGIVWRAETPSSFELRAKDDTHDASTTNWFHVTTAEERDAQLHHYPHLLMYNFHTLHFDPSDVRNVQAARHRHEPIVVAVGTNHLTLIDSLHGTIAATLAIDHVPVGPSVVADVDGDGVNDLLVTTATGYHGFTIKQHASGTTTAMVLVMGIAIAAMLYVSQHGMDFEIFGNTAGVLDEAEAELDDAPILGRSAAPEGLRRRAGKRSTD